MPDDTEGGTSKALWHTITVSVPNEAVATRRQQLPGERTSPRLAPESSKEGWDEVSAGAIVGDTLETVMP